MPSGSHSGSSGSHSSGGSSWGGGSSRSSGYGSSSGSFRPGHVYVHIGRSRYYLNGKPAVAQKLLSFLVVFAIFFIIIGAVNWSHNSNELSKIKEDYNYYQQMISYAEANPSHKKLGKITGKFYNEDCKKWYITYSLQTNFHTTLNGYSFSVYTLEELMTDEYAINAPISLAVDSSTVTSTTDSIPMDYKDMPLSRDGEWVEATKQVGIAKGFLFTGCALFVVGIVAIIVVSVKKGTKVNSEGAPISTSFETNTQPNLTGWTCEYCGGYEPQAIKKCTQCGAGKPQRKNLSE